MNHHHAHVHMWIPDPDVTAHYNCGCGMRMYNDSPYLSSQWFADLRALGTSDRPTLPDDEVDAAFG